MKVIMGVCVYTHMYIHTQMYINTEAHRCIKQMLLELKEEIDPSSTIKFESFNIPLSA